MALEPLHIADLKRRVDIGILTVRMDEFEAVLERFASTRTLADGKNIYELAHVRTDIGGETMVAITRVSEQGPGTAQAVARNLIDDLDPDWLFLVGIAGGVPDDEYTLGDVVLANRLHDFSVSAALQDEPDQYQITGGPMHQDVERLLSADLCNRLSGWNTEAAIGLKKPAVEIPVDPGGSPFYGPPEWQDKVRKSIEKHFPTGRPGRPPTGSVRPPAAAR